MSRPCTPRSGSSPPSPRWRWRSASRAAGPPARAKIGVRPRFIASSWLGSDPDFPYPDLLPLPGWGLTPISQLAALDELCEVARAADQHALHEHHRNGRPAGPHLERKAPAPLAEIAAVLEIPVREPGLSEQLARFPRKRVLAHADLDDLVRRHGVADFHHDVLDRASEAAQGHHAAEGVDADMRVLERALVFQGARDPGGDRGVREARCGLRCHAPAAGGGGAEHERREYPGEDLENSHVLFPPSPSQRCSAPGSPSGRERVFLRLSFAREASRFLAW